MAEKGSTKGEKPEKKYPTFIVRPEGGGSGTASEEGGAFKLSGQALAAIVVTAVAGNIVGARYFRRTLATQVSRHAQRKAEADRIFQEARARAREAQEKGWNTGTTGNTGKGGASFSARSVREKTPHGWEFDNNRRASFAEQRFDSQVLKSLSVLGVNNFVAGREEVRTAFYQRAMDLHPDRNSDGDDDHDSASGRPAGSKEDKEKEFKKIAEAYAWLDLNYYRNNKP